ncbi:MAG: 23S rRNA (uracil(1939)-C(5))-methyltransferase RlmD [Motiliproteus sp.]
MARYFKPAKKKPFDNTPVEVNITNLSHDGRGLARVNGKALFVDGALPGETVRAKYTNQKSKFAEATTLNVLQASLQRVTPDCPHFNQCGGCQIQHLAAESQIEIKQQQALAQLQRIGNTTPTEILPPLDGEHWHYRRRARLGLVVDRSGRISVGFRRKQSKKRVAIEKCPVLEPRGERLLMPLNQLLNRLQQPLAISHLEICLADEQAALVVRHPRPLPDADIELLQHMLREYGFTLFLQPGGIETLHQSVEEGASAISLSYQLDRPNDDNNTPLTLEFHPSDFTQINAPINRQMIDLALALLQPNSEDRILDLFCGLGNFSLPLACYAEKVVGVEAIESMVERGRHNAALNKLDNISFVAADLTQAVNDQPRFKALLKEGFNKVLLDPPRSGAVEVLVPLARLSPQQILYISCDPATLARDSAELVRLGYQLQRWTVINMFPHTSHVESIALFIKN